MPEAVAITRPRPRRIEPAQGALVAPDFENVPRQAVEAPVSVGPHGISAS
jgi:hypothetical protein